jgi:predicted PurR-regulated permease PerM
MVRSSSERVNPRLDLAAAYSWRFLVVAAAIGLVGWIAGQMLVVVVPVAVAILAARALWPLNTLLRRRGLPPAPSALLCLIALLLVLGVALGLAGAALAGEFDQLGPTVEEGIDDVTTWLVEDSPFDVTRDRIDDLREQGREALDRFVRSGGDGLASGAVVAAEIFAGALLALLVTFFVLKDARRWATRAVDRMSATRGLVADRCLHRAWAALGGYLRGVVVLGTVEAGAIGVSMFVVGANLVAPVMLLTFLAAFLPIVGAVIAGVVAVLVTLVTAGTGPAIIVAIVAIVVQQLDNDLLAPVVYGRALRLSPLVVLLGIAAGGALFGFIGTVFAVPFLAVVINTVDEWRHAVRDVSVADGATGGAGQTPIPAGAAPPVS